jgi:hypothetical protein
MAKPKRAHAKEQSQAMHLMNLTTGKWVSQAIAVAAELGIADALGDGFKSAAEIAKAVNASEDGIYRLMRALASVGLFTASEKRKFKLTSLGKLLRSDSVESVRGFACFTGHNSTWSPWGELRHSVRTGAPAFDHVFGVPIFEYLGKTPEASGVFDAAMTSLSTFESKAVINAYDFSRIGTIVDGRGRARAACRRDPQSKSKDSRHPVRSSARDERRPSDAPRARRRRSMRDRERRLLHFCAKWRRRLHHEAHRSRLGR